MKTFSIKTTVAAAATAATLLTSGIAPIAQANAEPIAIPGLTDKIHPKLPGPNCATKPWLCGPGVVVAPPAPPAPPPPAPPAGPSAGTKAAGAAALVIGGIIAGAAIAKATQPQQVDVEPAGNTDAHTAWCYGKYKSYRLWDNSWLSYSGERKPCISPYY
jgi:hypothetical protein